MNRLHHPLMVGAGIAISGIALWIAVRDIDWTQTAAAIRSADVEQLVFALAFLVAGIFLRAERWRIVIPTPVSRASMYRATAVGFFFNYVYPARAGDVIKVLSLHRVTGQSLARVGVSAAIDRLIDVNVLLLSTTAVFLLAPELVLGRTLFYAAAGGLTLGVVLALSPIGDKLLRRARDYLDGATERPVTSALRRLTDRLLNFRGELLAGHRQWALMAAAALVAAADYLSVYFLLVAFGWHLPLLAPVAVWAIVSLGAALPSAPAGIGVNQLACILGLGIFGIPAADAFAFSLALQVASFAAILLALLLEFGVGMHRRAAGPMRPRLRFGKRAAAKAGDEDRCGTSRL